MSEHRARGRSPTAGTTAALARAAGALVLAALAAGAGCATPEAPPLAEAIGRVKGADAPAPWRLALAPLEVRLSAAIGPSPTAEEHWSPVPLEPKLVRGILSSAAARSNAFAAIDWDRSLERFEAPPLAPEGAGRGGTGGAGEAAASRAVVRPSAIAVPPTLTARLAYLVAEPPPRGHVGGLYFERGADLLLTARVSRCSVGFVEHLSGHWANVVFLYIMWVWPAWLVADESYEARLEVEVELRAVAADRPLWTRTYRARALGELDSASRGWTFTGTLTIPGWLEPDNYRAAGERLLPYAWNEVAAELAKDLAAATLTVEEQRARGLRPAESAAVPKAGEPAERAGAPGAVTGTATAAGAAAVGGTAAAHAPGAVTRTAAATPPPARDEIEAGLPATLAVVVGAPKVLRSPILPPRFAAEEAEAVARLLVDPERGGLPPRNVSRVIEGRAPSSAYDAAPARLAVIPQLRMRAARARERDTVLVYFAGAGFALGGECWLVPRDLVASDARASAISLADIDRALGPCKARQVVVLDTSFDGEVRPGVPSRTVPPELIPGAASGPDSPVRAALERFAARHPRRVVIAAGAPGASVDALSPLGAQQQGLFTATLLAAASSDATDVDRDGTISLLEAFAAARRETGRISAASGEPQVPAMYPPGPDGEARAREVALSRAGGGAAAR
jgi:hypothetical protein